MGHTYPTFQAGEGAKDLPTVLFLRVPADGQSFQSESGQGAFSCSKWLLKGFFIIRKMDVWTSFRVEEI